MAQILLTAAGTIILLMGTGHFVLTLRDVWKPTSFTPTEESVRFAMQGAQLRFSRRINLWESWLGFNLSHSMGPIMFGVAILYAAQVHLAAFLESTFLQAVAEDLKGLKASVRASVRDALETHLRHSPTKVSRSRIKRLKGLSRPQYRLRIEEIRVFYDVDGTVVEILAIVPKSETESWLVQFGKT